jgi:very-short-patch-repair endonuclease
MEIKLPGKSMFYGADSKTFEAATILRKNMTLPELILWKKLRDKSLFKVKFRRQHPIDIFIVDFYCHKYKLVIEIDGEVHHMVDSIEYDTNRTAELKKFGITIIRFSNDEVVYNIDTVVNRIQKIITESAPL